MYRISVPALPPSLNQMYSGTHWGRRKAMVEEWHQFFWIAFKQAGLPKALKCPITLSVTEFSKRVVRDADNAVVAAKLCGDALKKFGYIEDDGPKYIETVILNTKKGEEDETVILIQ